MKYCAIPQCPILVTDRPYCPAHAVQREHARANYDIRRWYRTARWRHPSAGLRALALRLYPWCVDCLEQGRHELSTDVDHEIPHRGSPTLFWALENLRGRCKACHSSKTQRGL